MRYSHRAQHCAACSVGLDGAMRAEIMGGKAWPRALQAKGIECAGEESAAYCASTAGAATGREAEGARRQTISCGSA